MTTFDQVTAIQIEHYRKSRQRRKLRERLEAERTRLEQSWLSRSPGAGYNIAQKLKRLDNRIGGLNGKAL